MPTAIFSSFTDIYIFIFFQTACFVQPAVQTQMYSITIMEDYWKTASIYSWGRGPEAGTYKSGRVSLEKLQIIIFKKIHEDRKSVV